MMQQDYDVLVFKYKIEFTAYLKIFIRIITCKIMKYEKMMWQTIINSVKIQMFSVLYTVVVNLCDT